MREKSLFIMALVMFLLTAALGLTGRRLVLDSFVALEERQMLQNLDRARNALDRELQRLDATAADWAGWDEIYAYAQGGNPGFPRTNLADNNFTNLKVDFFVVADARGRLLYAKGFHHQLQKPITLPKALTQPLVSGDMMKQWGRKKSVNGLMRAGGLLLLCAARPILRSDQTGAPQGTVHLARLLDPITQRELGEATRLPFRLFPLPQGIAPRTGLDYGLPGKITIRRVLPDLAGQPGAQLSLTLPREVYQHGRTALNSFLLALAGVVLGALVLLWGLMSRMVLNPVTRLHTAVLQIRKEQNLGLRVPQKGQDEMSALGAEINRLLGELAASRAELEETHEKLSAIHHKVQEELKDALLVQQAVMPGSPQKHGRAVIHCHFTPSSVVCGDFFDVTTHGDQQVLLLVDVSGKGAGAAMVTVTLKFLFHKVLQTMPPEEAVSPEAVLRALDGEMGRFVPPHQHYATAICAVYSPGREELVICRAGHPHPLVFMPGQPAVKLADKGLPPLNFMFHGAPTEAGRDVAISLKTGVRVLFYTDGLVEVFDAQDREWGVEGLLGELQRHTALEGHALLKTLAAEASRRHQSPHPMDDQAMLLFEVCA